MSDVLSLFGDDDRTALVEQMRLPATGELPAGWPEGGLSPHPYASINRLMTRDEIEVLNADISARGLQRRIVMFEDQILDGRNRFLVGVGLGRFAANVDWRTHPDFIEFGGKGWDADEGTDPLAFVWSMEVRRHRSAKDAAMAAARYLNFIAKLKPEFPEGKTAKLRLPTQAELSKRHGISERLLNSAMALLDRAEPEVVQAVDEGRLPLADAADVVSRLAPEEQRSIAQAPDRKAAKAKVKAAKKKVAPKVPDLPAPLSRTDLASFAETIINEARRVAGKHGGAGASMSADLVLGAARQANIVEGGEGATFTRAMQLALGKLREEAKPASGRKAPKKGPETGDGMPTTPPMGGEWSLQLGGLDAKHSKASIAVFAEEDGTFSTSFSYDLSHIGRATPWSGSHADLRAALIAVGGDIVTAFDAIERNEGGFSDRQIGAAKTGRAWLEKKFAAWQLPRPEPRANDIQSSVTERAGEGAEPSEQGAPETLPDTPSLARATYDRLVEEAAPLKGQHTQASAEPILRAAEAADIRISQVERDIGHQRGTIGGWRARLGLQKAERNPQLGHREGATA